MAATEAAQEVARANIAAAGSRGQEQPSLAPDPENLESEIGSDGPSSLKESKDEVIEVDDSEGKSLADDLYDEQVQPQEDGGNPEGPFPSPDLSIED